MVNSRSKKITGKKKTLNCQAEELRCCKRTKVNTELRNSGKIQRKEQCLKIETDSVKHFHAE